MHAHHSLSVRLFSAAIAWTLATGVSHAVVSGVSASNVDAYFGSQSDGYQDSNPTGLNPWSPIGPGPYLGSFLPPGVPAAPGGNTPPSNVTPFGGTPSISNFNDGFGNSATSAIVAFPGSPVGVIDDAQIALNMRLVQSGSTQYAYEQLNYSADYALANTVNSAGVSVGVQDGFVSRSFWVAGSVGSFVDFGGQMNFWDVPTSGPAIFLGQLLFSYNNFSPGPFGAFVGSSGIITAPPGFVNSPDVVRVTGDFFLAGDPSTISVESVPEPSSLVLAALGIVGLFWAARRRRSLA